MCFLSINSIVLWHCLPFPIIHNDRKLCRCPPSSLENRKCWSNQVTQILFSKYIYNGDMFSCYFQCHVLSFFPAVRSGNRVIFFELSNNILDRSYIFIIKGGYSGCFLPGLVARRMTRFKQSVGIS